MYNQKKIIDLVPYTLAKANKLLYTFYIIIIKKNMELNYIKQYSSIGPASKQIKVNHGTLLNYIAQYKLFKSKYMITKRRNNK